MDLTPYIGDTPIRPEAFSIRVDPEDRTRVSRLTARAGEIVVVNNSETLALARHCAGQIKALLNEIDEARKASKRPQTLLNNAIEELATNIAAPLQNEQKRVLGLMNGYVAKVEAEEKAERDRREQALKFQVELQQRKLKEAEQAKALAEAQAREAQEETARRNFEAKARQQAEAAENAQMARELAEEAALSLNQKTPKAKIPGGRVDHPYEFELLDVQACVKAGGWRLLQWSLDKRACQDSIRAQLEIDKNTEPSLPGIRITKTTSVSVRATI